MTTTSHYFIGIPITSQLENTFSSWQQDLRSQLPYKQWPNKHDLHITLTFLGSVERVTIQSIQKALRNIESLPQFVLEVGDIGTFGNPKGPRILWAGVRKNKSLTLLHEKVESSMEEFGFKPEQRAYRPHITLAKKWNGPLDEQKIIELKDRFKRENYLLTVKEVALYQIYPKQDPKYKIVTRYNLRGENNGTTDQV
ncbi:RNA 2',3'-cyclic phosphodiesterase [Lentibacillus sp. Marseille-P4043]|uniref:RNA 2',3'-cyclic phosphodiesterase n=1 Tax=Lentibacillus sp. Marseille-P4043 TaxID=2040293 RepID=UPI000D0ABACE|nr:RNA 2',3'-cyclic phosphodiesterase [Lentibacillus sp. Marseille-P4043]